MWLISFGGKERDGNGWRRIGTGMAGWGQAWKEEKSMGKKKKGGRGNENGMRQKECRWERRLEKKETDLAKLGPVGWSAAAR